MHLEINIDKVEDLMARDRMSYKDLADKMEIHRNTLLNMKKNPDHFTGKQVSAMAKAFKVKGKDLLIEKADKKERQTT